MPKTNVCCLKSIRSTNRFQFFVQETALVRCLVTGVIKLSLSCHTSCHTSCFRQSVPVVTLYTNLGEDAVIHGINETGPETVITSHELLPKFRKILPATPSVRNIVYFENPIKKTPTEGEILI